MESYRKNILEYLKKNIKKGYTLESLKWALVGQGYSKPSIERAISELNKELARNAPILKEKPVIKYEIFDENDNPIIIKNPWWKKIFKK
ncbi:hypothetical protein K0A97_01645 [Patescibacteria group bacterium]|nr:hypothetical protein [Patescibacteria group bacterium]